MDLWNKHVFGLKQTCSLLWQIRKPNLSRYNWPCGVNSWIPINMVLTYRLILDQDSQTWFSIVLGKYHFYHELLEYVINNCIIWFFIIVAGFTTSYINFNKQPGCIGYTCRLAKRTVWSVPCWATSFFGPLHYTASFYYDVYWAIFCLVQW